MTLDEIRYFVTVYQQGGITPAARLLNISPQGLSKALRKLEGELGMALFTRTPQGMVPNDQARLIYDDALVLVERQASIRAKLAESKQRSEGLRLFGRDSHVGDVVRRGALDYARMSGVQVLTAFSAASESEFDRLFMEDSYDYRYITETLSGLTDLAREPLFELPFELVVNADDPLAHERSAPIASLAGRSVFTESLKFAHIVQLQSACAEQGVDVQFREVPEAYIHDLLSTTTSCIYVSRIHKQDSRFAKPGLYVHLPLDPPLVSRVVLEARKGPVDPTLLACIRHRLREEGFGVPWPDGEIVPPYTAETAAGAATGART